MVDFTNIITNFSSYISNPLGLFAFGALIILIILYLIKPRPKKRTIPSLLFLIRDLGKSKKESFFKQFLRDFLFIFHLLLILLLATASTSPFYLSDESVINENTVLILDTSASSKTIQGGRERIDIIKQEAQKYLDGDISIIVLSNEPIIVLHEGDAGEAAATINKVEATDGLSRIGDAILAANNVLQDKKGKIVVISDFINTFGVDPFVAKKSLESEKRYVQFVDIKNKAQNIGIVDLQFNEKDGLVSIKNFKDKQDDVKVTINGQDFNREIGPGVTDRIVFGFVQGKNTIEIKNRDDFPVDDKAEFIVPEARTKRILLITNEINSNIATLLNAYKETWNENVEIEIAEPPKLPLINHDLIIVSEIENGKVPGSVFTQIRELVKKGSSVIIMAQQNSNSINYGDVIPVDIQILQGASQVSIVNSFSRVTRDVTFTKVENHFSANIINGLVIAESASQQPLLVVSDHGQGKVFYYGILDKQSGFKDTISYPIFWQQLLDYMLDTENVKDNNYKIGDVLEFSEKIDIKTPTREIKESRLSLSEVGVYELEGGRKVGVNLLNEVESAVDAETSDLNRGTYDVTRSDQRVKKRLINLIIYITIALLFLELLYVKIRGDL